MNMAWGQHVVRPRGILPGCSSSPTVVGVGFRSSNSALFMLAKDNVTASEYKTLLCLFPSVPSLKLDAVLFSNGSPQLLE